MSLSLLSQISNAQFAPIVGQPGTTAMYKDSSAFVDWAASCTVVRGYQDISQPAGPYADVGDNTMALGMAGANGVVSLGDGGYVILQFSFPIIDAPGPDLAVFENGFDNTFLELAFVEVSSDGINYFRFPATSNTDTTTQTGSFGSTNATQINNLAGKYRGLYGTPFDLADISATTLLNPQAVTHVKVVDVVGCIQNTYCTRDVNNYKVNDPWPTAFGSGGFDLDAVGVIHNQAEVGVREFELTQIRLFPNPSKDELHVELLLDTEYTVSVQSLFGQEIIQLKKQTHSSLVNVSELNRGVYFLIITHGDEKKVAKFIKS